MTCSHGNSVQSTLCRIRRDTDGKYLTRDGKDWTDDASQAWETNYPPAAAERAWEVQSAADHSFFAEVVPALPVVNAA